MSDFPRLYSKFVVKFIFAPTHLTHSPAIPLTCPTLPQLSTLALQAHTGSEGRLLSLDFIFVFKKCSFASSPPPLTCFQVETWRFHTSPCPEWQRPGKEAELPTSGWHLLEAFFHSVSVFIPQRLKERSEQGVLWAGLEQSLPSLPERYTHVLVVHTYVCLCSHMYIWTNEVRGGQRL